MNTRFCSRCGKKHVYSTVKPKMCPCGCDMDAAFTTAAIAVPAAPSRPSNPLVAASTQRPLRSPLSRRPAPIIADTQDDEDFDDTDDSYDENEVQALASEWAQEIDASMFFSPTKGGPVKLGDLSNVREAAEKMAEQSVAKKPRKGRK